MTVYLAGRERPRKSLAHKRRLPGRKDGNPKIPCTYNQFASRASAQFLFGTKNPAGQNRAVPVRSGLRRRSSLKIPPCALWRRQLQNQRAKLSAPLHPRDQMVNVQASVFTVVVRQTRAEKVQPLDQRWIL